MDHGHAVKVQFSVRDKRSKRVVVLVKKGQIQIATTSKIL